ncbi:MAG: zinc ABC transporter substrate-binding protein [Nitrososphaera sp.]
MNQQRAALAAIAVAIPLAMVATLYTGTARHQEQAGSEHRLKIATSFYPLYDFTSHVAGDNAEIMTLIPPGVEPHDWEPTAGDISKARSADILIINGAGFEKWSEGIGAKRIVNTSEGIEMRGINDDDPHIWLDPALAKVQVENIKAALIEADPKNADQYSENAAAYARELDGLDAYIKAGLANCKKSDFIAFHDAFGRFAARYGLTQHAIEGISPEGEVLPQRIEQVIGLARQLGIKVIYSEDLVDSRLADVIAGELSGRVLVLSPVEGISKTEQAAGIGYIDKMKENVLHLKESLQCQ